MSIVQDSQLATLARRYSEAWNAHDLDAVMALHTDDVRFRAHSEGQVEACGQDEVRAAFALALEHMHELRWELHRFLSTAEGFVQESRMSGCTTSGSPFSCDCLDLMAVRDGLIARKDSYVDPLPLLAALGGHG